MADGTYVKTFVKEGIVDIEGQAELNIMFCGGGNTTEENAEETEVKQPSE